MCSESPRVVAGFPEMWQPAHDKYRLFVETAWKLQPMVNEMTSQCVTGQLADVVCRMVFAAADTMGALLTLVLNGYGYDAMKLARSIYETELNIVWLKNHPDEIRDFLDYNIIRQKQLYDVMNEEEQQKSVSKERYERMMAEYTEILPRFATGRDKTRPRNEWCRVSIYDRAKEAGQLPLHQIFYRQASSMHHGDIGGLISHLDSNMHVELAPSWNWLDDALINGLGAFVRCLNYFDEVAQLGFKERLENGPNENYVTALKNLPGS